MDSNKSNQVDNRRKFGSHLTSIDIFNQYIFPEIENKLSKYIWVDFFAGEGNLILPILDNLPLEERESFFNNQMYLFDIQEEMIYNCIEKAKSYGISEKTAQKNIKLRDNLENYPLEQYQKPIYHITNPPYLYLGYIKKHKETQKYINLFKNKNEGYQDLYQIAMMNDLRYGIQDLIYIIPSNFLYGASVSNKFRKDFLSFYKINKIFIFESKVFEFTGTNICIGFFSRKKEKDEEDQNFIGFKIKNDSVIEKEYNLKLKYKYRAGSEFDEFLESYKVIKPLKIKYYLEKKETSENKGNNRIRAIDANKYENNNYTIINLHVNDFLKRKIESNVLYIKTVDTGSYNGRVGLSLIKDDYGVDSIFVSGNTYRTHPIQLFITPEISIDDQLLLMRYFNYLLEYFRNETDSEFLTTYKYSNADYTRKYLGLNQARKLIETFPYDKINPTNRKILNNYIENNHIQKLFKLMKSWSVKNSPK